MVDIKKRRDCRERERGNGKKKVEKYEMRVKKRRRETAKTEKGGKTKTDGEGILWYCSERGKRQRGDRAKEKRE